MTTNQDIQSMAAGLLEKGEVDAVIGYCRGSLPWMTQPFMARTPEQAKKLMFNAHCRMNLAAYLNPDRFKGETGRIAVFAKGCDSRNMVTQIQENRYRREQIHIIGLPCTGMVDKTRLFKQAGGDILSMTEQGEELVLTLATGEKRLARADLLQDNCKTCISRNPVMFDELVGEKVDELDMGEDRFKDVTGITAMDTEKRKAFFADMVSSCIRCYACRSACPLCYCPTCFVDESAPQWVGKTCDPTDVMTFHLVRAFHDAGRCTDCGACEAACPMDIKMRAFTRKTIYDCKQAYGWETGMNPDSRPALDQFSLKDPNEFIR